MFAHVFFNIHDPTHMQAYRHENEGLIENHNATITKRITTICKTREHAQKRG